MLTKVKSIPAKTIVLTIVFTLLIACWTGISAYGVAADPDISAGLELSRELSSEKFFWMMSLQ